VSVAGDEAHQAHMTDSEIAQLVKITYTAWQGGGSHTTLSGHGNQTGSAFTFLSLQIQAAPTWMSSVKLLLVCVERKVTGDHTE